MSEKRWALTKDASRKVEIIGPDAYALRGFGPGCIEQVEIPGPDESIVRHSTLREWERVFMGSDCVMSATEVGRYLPKPQRKTLRTVLREAGYSNAWIEEVAAEAGIDPDKRTEP